MDPKSTGIIIIILNRNRTVEAHNGGAAELDKSAGGAEEDTGGGVHPPRAAPIAEIKGHLEPPVGVVFEPPLAVPPNTGRVRCRELSDSLNSMYYCIQFQMLRFNLRLFAKNICREKLQ